MWATSKEDMDAVGVVSKLVSTMWIFDNLWLQLDVGGNGCGSTGTLRST